MEAMKYTTYTTSPLSDYTIIGNTTSSALSHPELGVDGSIPVVPSYIYYLQRSTNTVAAGVPEQAVVARKYKRGLVVYRAYWHGANQAFEPTVSTAVDLGGEYRRVRYDGSLSDVVSSVVLRGYEGAVFVSASCPLKAPIPGVVQYCAYPAGSPECANAVYWLNPATTDASCITVGSDTLCPMHNTAYMEVVPAQC